MNAKDARSMAEKALLNIFSKLLNNVTTNSAEVYLPEVNLPLSKTLENQSEHLMDVQLYEFYQCVIQFLESNAKEKNNALKFHEQTALKKHTKSGGKNSELKSYLNLVLLFETAIKMQLALVGGEQGHWQHIIHSPAGRTVLFYFTFLSIGQANLSIGLAKNKLFAFFQDIVVRKLHKLPRFQHTVEFLMMDDKLFPESPDNPLTTFSHFLDRREPFKSPEEIISNLQRHLKSISETPLDTPEFIYLHISTSLSIKCMLFLFYHLNQFEEKDWVLKAFQCLVNSECMLFNFFENQDIFFNQLLSANGLVICSHLRFIEQYKSKTHHCIQKNAEQIIKLYFSELMLFHLIEKTDEINEVFINKAIKLIEHATSSAFSWHKIELTKRSFWQHIAAIFSQKSPITSIYLQLFNQHWEKVVSELFKHDLIEEALKVIATHIHFENQKITPLPHFYIDVHQIHCFINELKSLTTGLDLPDPSSPLYQKEPFLNLIEKIKGNTFGFSELHILRVFINNNHPNIAAWLLEELRAVMPGLKKNLFNTEPSLDTYETRILPLKEQMITIIETLLPQDTSTKTEALKSLVYQRLESTFLASTYAEKRICATDKPTEPKIDKPKNKKRRKQRNKKGRKEARQQNVLHGGGGGGPHPFTHFKDQPRIHRSSLPKPLLELANLITRETKEYLVLSGAAVLSLYLNRQDIDDYDCQLADVNLNQLNNLLIKNGYPSKLIGKKHPILTLTIKDEYGEYDIEISSIEKGDKDLTKALKETHKYRDFKLTTLTCILTSEDYLDISGLPGAIKAIKEKKISAVFNHPDLFYSDPTRLIRFVKLRLQFPDYTVEENLARIIATLNMKKCFEDCILNKEEGKTNQGRIGTSLERKLFSRFSIKDVLSHLNQIGLIEGLTGFTCEQINLITPTIINHCHDKQSGYDKKQRFFLILAINYCLLNPKQPDFKQWPFYQVAKHLKREHRDLFFYVQQQLLKPDEDYFVNPPQKQKNDVDELINEIAYANKQTKTEQIETKTEPRAW